MQILEFLARLAAALLMGVVVGMERQWRQRMAGTRTNALVAAGASAFVMCAFLTHEAPNPTQIVAYVVSGVGFLGAGVIFKDAGSVRGLNTAATIWCSAAIGAICGLGNLLHALILTGAVLCTNLVLRPLTYRFYPVQVSASKDEEVAYGFELICRPEDEAHMRALMLQTMSRSPLTLTSLRTEDIEGTNRMRVTAHIRGLGRQDEALEQLVVRLSLEAGVSSVSWALASEALE